MKKKAIIIILVILFSFSSILTSQESEKQRVDLKKITAFINEMMKEWKVPGAAVGIVKDGEVVFSEGFGLRNIDENLPVTPNTLFVLASVTKAFITMSMGMLVDDGLLDWDTPVRTYLPNFILKDDFATMRITPRDMVTHRSGLPRHDYMWFGSNLTPAELVESLRYLEPSADLRARYQYNNLMFISGGYLIGKVSGTPWDKFVGERIFNPLGMTSSNCSINELKKSEEFARSYSRRDDEYTLNPFPPPTDILRSGPRGSGSINSNINDMTKWMLLHLNRGRANGKRIISIRNIDRMHTPQIVTSARPVKSDVLHQSYGMGWSIDSYRGHYRVHHGGGSMGFATHVTLLPHEKFGIVVLTNASTPLPDLICNYSSDILLGKEPIDWNKRFQLQRRGRPRSEEKPVPGTKPAHQLIDYTGEYEHLAYGLLKITLENGSLKADIHGNSSNLKHWHYEVFRNEDGTNITFHTNAKGNIDRVSIPLEPAVDDIVFIRKTKE